MDHFVILIKISFCRNLWKSRANISNSITVDIYDFIEIFFFSQFQEKMTPFGVDLVMWCSNKNSAIKKSCQRVEKGMILTLRCHQKESLNCEKENIHLMLHLKQL